MEAVIRKAKSVLAQPVYPTNVSEDFQNGIKAGRVTLKALPNVLSIGNEEVAEIRLLVARLALRMRNLTNGYLVYTEEGQVKYYDEDYSFTAVHLATFTNLPVYCVMASEELAF